MRIYASINWTIVGSDYGLSPVRRQAIIWTNAGFSLHTFKNKRKSTIFTQGKTFQNVVDNMAATLSRPRRRKCLLQVCMMYVWISWWVVIKYTSVVNKRQPSRGRICCKGRLGHHCFLWMTCHISHQHIGGRSIDENQSQTQNSNVCQIRKITRYACHGNAGNVFPAIDVINPSRDPIHKSHKASDKYPPMHHFVTEMCTHVHISVTKWCIVGYRRRVLWELWDWSIGHTNPMLTSFLRYKCTGDPLYNLTKFHTI